MKRLLLLTVLAAGLSGCITSTVSIESKDTLTVDDRTTSEQFYGENPGGGWSTCVPYLVKVPIDGSTWFVQLPSICDPSPYIFKGDPGPDMWEKCENIDPVWQEKIIQSAFRVAENEQ